MKAKNTPEKDEIKQRCRVTPNAQIHRARDRETIRDGGSGRNTSMDDDDDDAAAIFTLTSSMEISVDNSDVHLILRKNCIVNGQSRKHL